MNYQEYYNQYGGQYNVSPNVLENIAKLESSENPNAINNWDSNAKAGTPSAGVMQFIEPTFNSYYDQAAAQNPQLFQNMGQKDWMNPEQQIATTAWAINSGKGSAWATYDKARSGPQPVSKKLKFGGTDINYAGAAPVGASPSEARIALAFGNDPLGLAQGYMRRAAATSQPSSVGGQPPTDGAGAEAYSGPVGNDWKFLRQQAQQFGLRNDPGDSQTTGGQHATNSLHYQGRAIDYGSARNTPEQLNNWWSYLNKNKQDMGITQLFWEDRGGPNEHIHSGVGQ